MTIDEAIEHATQIADSYKDTAPDCDCARDHRQLAEWLKKARVYEKAKKRSASMIRKLKEENDKLRELAMELWEGYMDPTCGDCTLEGKPACAYCPICARESAVIDHMRELGIEVSG